MGKGLNPTKGGTHVAYCAGTGVLVFVDLVGHLLLKQVAKNGGPDVLGKLHAEMEGIPSLPDDFRFEINNSFASEEEGIALELMKALESIDPESTAFKSNIQYSNQKPNTRWDESYFRRIFD